VAEQTLETAISLCHFVYDCYVHKAQSNQSASFIQSPLGEAACLFAISHVEQFHTIPRLSFTSSSFYNTQPSSSFIQFKGEECSQESGTIGPRVVSVLAVAIEEVRRFVSFLSSFTVERELKARSSAAW